MGCDHHNINTSRQTQRVYQLRSGGDVWVVPRPGTLHSVPVYKQGAVSSLYMEKRNNTASFYFYKARSIAVHQKHDLRDPVRADLSRPIPPKPQVQTRVSHPKINANAAHLHVHRPTLLSLPFDPLQARRRGCERIIKPLPRHRSRLPHGGTFSRQGRFLAR